MADFVKLYTAQGEQLPEVPWDIYPRPQLRRDSYFCLNGTWDFAVVSGADTPEAYDRTIRVPFAPESMLSGVDEVFGEGTVLWYQRQFVLPEGFCRGRVLLHFGAVDQSAEVTVNGVSFPMHTGGYDAFTLDITDALQEVNTIIVRVEDRLDGILPYGKQCRKRGGMWYTPVSGIWQTVWLESVPEEYIRRIRITPAADGMVLETEGADRGEITIRTPQGEERIPLHAGRAEWRTENPRMWSPEDPYLYDCTITAGDDTVQSYFALRTLDIQTADGLPRLCLNGKPYFFHGLLDQGYWSDGLFTPAAPENYTEDILRMKKLGFNMLRKHIKVEPEHFYYECDRLGMVVFQDMVNIGPYSFLRDTALPTIGLQRRSDVLLHTNPAARKAFVESMAKTVRQLYNHPCICCWTIFNEGWGQFCGSKMYELMKKLDESRFIDTASGWFAGCDSDVDSRHVYFRKVKLRAGKKPLVLSEFGGYSFKPEGHAFNTEQTYGYGKYSDRGAFVAALQKLYTDEVLPLIGKGLCAAIYTQVSDVEDETNGLLSYDRRIEKVLPEEFAPVSEALMREMK